MATSIQFEFRQRQYLVKFRLSFFMLCLLFFALLCQLGVWQLHRYAFKKEMLAMYQERANAAPKALNAMAGNADLQFQRVVVQGSYLAQQSMLVQNRMHDGQMGFEVITPFKIQGENKLLLVNRGWVKTPPALAQEDLSTTTNVVGVVKLLNEYQFILGKNILQPDAKPLLMQKIDTNEISQLLQQAVYPFVLRLDASAPQGFTRDWQALNVNPERHMGYAVQWFLMAAVLLIAYLSFCIEKVEDNYGSAN
jgi:surfeit locus 1 family protein